MSDQLSEDLASLTIPREAPPRRGRARWLLMLVVAGALGGLSYVIGFGSLKATMIATPVELTEVTLLSPAQESVVLSAAGYVVPQRLSRVTAKLSARIAAVHVHEGDTVQAGALLLALEEGEHRALVAATESRVLAARAAVEAARAALNESAQQTDRQETLLRRGVSARATAEDLRARRAVLEANLHTAEAQVQVAQAEAGRNRIRLGLMTIRAPIAGVVINKPPSVGDLVGPLTGTIVDIADFESQVVEADVPENRLHLVQPGAPCEIILDAYPNRRHRGTVASISKKVNRAKATVVVKVKFVDPSDLVLPEMAARIGVLRKPLDDRALKEQPKIVVPSAAIVTHEGRNVVFTVEDGHAHRVPVQLGAPIGSGFVLLDGPPPGTKLVRGPVAGLIDGARIKERSE